MTGCGSKRLRLRCGTKSAIGLPWRQISTVSPVASTSASRAESLVFASWMLTIFMQSSFYLLNLGHLVHFRKMAFERVVISMLCCGPGEVVVANEVLDGTNVMGQLLGEG